MLNLHLGCSFTATLKPAFWSLYFIEINQAYTHLLVVVKGLTVVSNFWIILPVLVLAAIIVYILFKRRLDKQSTQVKFQELQKIIRAERQRISGEIHDDIGSGLSAIKIYAEIATNKSPENADLKNLNQMVIEISKRINEIVWSTNSESDHINHLIFYAEEQLSKLFEYSSIQFQSDLPTTTPDRVLSSVSRKNIYLLLKEIAHNALKHSQASVANLIISFDQNKMIIIFKDNGIGFKLDQNQVSGMGTLNINKRIAILGGDLHLTTTNGTSYTIQIPLDTNSELFAELDISKDDYLERLNEKRVSIVSKNPEFS